MRPHVVKREAELAEGDVSAAVLDRHRDAVLVRDLEGEHVVTRHVASGQHLAARQRHRADRFIFVCEGQGRAGQVGHGAQRAVPVIRYRHGDRVFVRIYLDAPAACADFLHGVGVFADIRDCEAEIAESDIGAVVRDFPHIAVFVGNAEGEHIVRGHVASGQHLAARQRHAAFRFICICNGHHRPFGGVRGNGQVIIVLFVDYAHFERIGGAVIGDPGDAALGLLQGIGEYLAGSGRTGFIHKISGFIMEGTQVKSSPAARGRVHGDLGDGVAVGVHRRGFAGKGKGKGIPFAEFTAFQDLDALQRDLAFLFNNGVGHHQRLDQSSLALVAVGHGVPFGHLDLHDGIQVAAPRVAGREGLPGMAPVVAGAQRHDIVGHVKAVRGFVDHAVLVRQDLLQFDDRLRRRRHAVALPHLFNFNVHRGGDQGVGNGDDAALCSLLRIGGVGGVIAFHRLLPDGVPVFIAVTVRRGQFGPAVRRPVVGGIAGLCHRNGIVHRIGAVRGDLVQLIGDAVRAGIVFVVVIAGPVFPRRDGAELVIVHVPGRFVDVCGDDGDAVVRPGHQVVQLVSALPADADRVRLYIVVESLFDITVRQDDIAVRAGGVIFEIFFVRRAAVLGKVDDQLRLQGVHFLGDVIPLQAGQVFIQHLRGFKMFGVLIVGDKVVPGLVAVIACRHFRLYPVVEGRGFQALDHQRPLLVRIQRFGGGHAHIVDLGFAEHHTGIGIDHALEQLEPGVLQLDRRIIFVELQQIDVYAAALDGGGVLADLMLLTDGGGMASAAVQRGGVGKGGRGHVAVFVQCQASGFHIEPDRDMRPVRNVPDGQQTRVVVVGDLHTGDCGFRAVFVHTDGIHQYFKLGVQLVGQAQRLTQVQGVSFGVDVHLILDDIVRQNSRRQIPFLQEIFGRDGHLGGGFKIVARFRRYVDFVIIVFARSLGAGDTVPFRVADLRLVGDLVLFSADTDRSGRSVPVGKIIIDRAGGCDHAVCFRCRNLDIRMSAVLVVDGDRVSVQFHALRQSIRKAEVIGIGIVYFGGRIQDNMPCNDPGLLVDLTVLVNIDPVDLIFLFNRVRIAAVHARVIINFYSVADRLGAIKAKGDRAALIQNRETDPGKIAISDPCSLISIILAGRHNGAGIAFDSDRTGVQRQLAPEIRGFLNKGVSVQVVCHDHIRQRINGALLGVNIDLEIDLVVRPVPLHEVLIHFRSMRDRREGHLARHLAALVLVGRLVPDRRLAGNAQVAGLIVRQDPRGKGDGDGAVACARGELIPEHTLVAGIRRDVVVSPHNTVVGVFAGGRGHGVGRAVAEGHRNIALKGLVDGHVIVDVGVVHQLAFVAEGNGIGKRLVGLIFAVGIVDGLFDGAGLFLKFDIVADVDTSAVSIAVVLDVLDVIDTLGAGGLPVNDRRAVGNGDRTDRRVVLDLISVQDVYFIGAVNAVVGPYHAAFRPVAADTGNDLRAAVGIGDRDVANQDLQVRHPVVDDLSAHSGRGIAEGQGIIYYAAGLPGGISRLGSGDRGLAGLRGRGRGGNRGGSPALGRGAGSGGRRRGRGGGRRRRRGGGRGRLHRGDAGLAAGFIGVPVDLPVGRVILEGIQLAFRQRRGIGHGIHAGIYRSTQDVVHIEFKAVSCGRRRHGGAVDPDRGSVQRLPAGEGIAEFQFLHRGVGRHGCAVIEGVGAVGVGGQRHIAAVVDGHAVDGLGCVEGDLFIWNGEGLRTAGKIIGVFVQEAELRRVRMDFKGERPVQRHLAHEPGGVGDGKCDFVVPDRVSADLGGADHPAAAVVGNIAKGRIRDEGAQVIGQRDRLSYHRVETHLLNNGRRDLVCEIDRKAGVTLLLRPGDGPGDAHVHRLSGTAGQIFEIECVSQRAHSRQEHCQHGHQKYEYFHPVFHNTLPLNHRFRR